MRCYSPENCFLDINAVVSTDVKTSVPFTPSLSTCPCFLCVPSANNFVDSLTVTQQERKLHINYCKNMGKKSEYLNKTVCNKETFWLVVLMCHSSEKMECVSNAYGLFSYPSGLPKVPIQRQTLHIIQSYTNTNDKGIRIQSFILWQHINDTSHCFTH